MARCGVWTRITSAHPSSASSSTPVCVRPGRVAVGRHVRVVVAQVRATLRDARDHGRGRRVAVVLDVGLEGDADDADLGALERPAALVERLGGEVHDVARHPEVDVAGELDEPLDEVELARPPGR